MLEDIVYVVIYGFVFASLYGIMTVGFSFICGLGGFYDIALPAYLMVGGFLYVMLRIIHGHLHAGCRGNEVELCGFEGT